MNNETIRCSVKEVVRQHNQPKQLADRIIAWFDAIFNGNETLVERESVRRRLDLILEEIELEPEEGEFDEDTVANS